MKRLLVIFLAFLYLITTSGVVVSTHYCMGEVAGYVLGQNDEHICGTCGMLNDGCCHDDLSVLKLDDDHQSHSISVNNPVPAIASVQGFWQTQKLTPTEKSRIRSSDGAPPLYTSNWQAMFCVFRI